MPDVDEEQLRISRRNLKSAVTKHLGTLSKLIAEEDDAAVRSRLTTLKKTFGRLEAAHDAYHDILTDDAQIEASEQWLTDVQKSYIDGISSARSWLKSRDPDLNTSGAASAADSQSHESDPTVSPSELMALLTLPKAEIPIFRGDPLEYQSFIALFNEAVHNKVVDDQIRLTRLLQYTDGDAKHAIRNCALLGGTTGYNQARDILKDRFGNSHLISRKIIDDLKSGKQCLTGNDIQQLADDLVMASTVLKGLKMLSEVDTQQSIKDILARCPTWIAAKWRTKALECKRDSDKYPTFDCFVKFVQGKASDMCDPVYGSAANNSSKSSRRGSSNVVVGAAGSSDAPQSAYHNAPMQSQHANVRRPVQPSCTVCQQNHKVYQCVKFKGMSVAERLNVVRRAKLCYNCLLPFHSVSQCRRQSFCKQSGCQKKHSSFLHQTECQTGSNSNVSETTPSTTVNPAPISGSNGYGGARSQGTCAYLPVVKVLVNGKFPTYALLDSGSTNTLISKRLASELPCSDRTDVYDMSTIAGTFSQSYNILSITVSCMDGSQSQVFSNVIVHDKVPYAPPDKVLDLKDYPYLADLPLSHVGNDIEVDMLIGMDYGYVQMPLEVRPGPRPNMPYATRSLFGWALCGPVPDSKSHNVVSNLLNMTTINDQIQNLWNMESVNDERQSWSVNDKKVIDRWQSELEFVDGHYCLPIPFVDGEPNMPNNKFVAMHRLKNLSSRLERTHMRDRYEKQLFDLVDKNYAEPVPPDELDINDGSVFYLPHHNVTSKSKPDKLRIVFDCAAKYSGVSLNNQCMQGPDLVNKLLHVLLRFRQFKHAITADIEAMYHQVKIPPKHRNCLRFLWQRSDGSIQELRMTSHLFGGVWCSASSTFALRKCVTDQPCSDLIKNTVNQSFYVDDMLKSVASKTDGVEVIKGTKQVLADRGFNLTKFMTNDNELLNEISESDRAQGIREITPEISSKALGMMWNINDDQFYYVIKCDPPTDSVTKRAMLSFVSSLYDPLGLIGPIAMLGKLLFQEAVRLGLSWDTVVPKPLADKWCEWLTTLHTIHDLKFDRCVIPEGYESGAMELHHFLDGSLKGYGANSFLRITNRYGRIHTRLLMAKSRLAPLKQITVPRLELCAAVVAVQMDCIIRRELEIDLLPSTFWSDSQIILSYISNETKRFKIFVGNRVSYIRDNTEPSQWRFIPGDQNPADVTSRGCLADSLPESWFTGPTFLSCHKSSWPSFHSSSSDHDLSTDPEVKRDEMSPVVINAAVNSVSNDLHPLDKLIEHYSCVYRLKKALCWWLRILRIIRGDKFVMNDKHIGVPEMRHAENILIKHVQNQTYHREICDIKRGNAVKCSSPIRDLNPVLLDGILVVGGRIKHSSVKESFKHPVILPSNHKFSNLILRESHNGAHLGTEWTLGLVRSKYWIPNARNRLKNIRKQCITCKKLYGKPMQQQMADLPPERCSPNVLPFFHVGLDIFGPFYVRVGRAQVKRFGVVFTCFSTRAIHLEVLCNMEADSFINALLRFAARRGFPAKVWSDNGTNIVGAKSEMQKSLKQLDRGKIISAARHKDIEWCFNPPYSSHHGGVYERQIRTVRQVLLAVLGLSPCLTDEILQTAFCEVENIINSRPVTKCSDDVNDSAPLTPNHLLLLRGNDSLAMGVTHKSDLYRRRWRHVKYLTDLFWRRWTKEYLSSLQKRSKWHDKHTNLSVGDLVLITDDNAPRGMWPLGLVVQCNMGRDGLVRSASLRTHNTEMVRPITKLVHLEGREWFANAPESS